MTTAIEEAAKHSNDEVQRAVDMVDGKDDGIDHEPENDVQQVLHGLEDGTLDLLEACSATARIIVSKGLDHGTPEDWTALAMKLGPAVYSLAKTMATIIGPLL